MRYHSSLRALAKLSCPQQRETWVTIIKIIIMGRRTGVLDATEIDATISELEVLIASSEGREVEEEKEEAEASTSASASTSVSEDEEEANICNGWSATTRMESRHPRRHRLRSVVGICLFLALTGIVYLGYFCPDHVCALTSREIKEPVRLSESLSVAAAVPPVVVGSAALSSVSVELDRNGLLSVHPAFKLQSIQGSLGYDDVFANDTFQFDINAHDVMVFLHIQKTGKCYTSSVFHFTSTVCLHKKKKLFFLIATIISFSDF